MGQRETERRRLSPDTVFVPSEPTFVPSNMAESETMSIDTSNEAQDDPLQDLSYDKLEEIVETTL